MDCSSPELDGISDNIYKAGNSGLANVIPCASEEAKEVSRQSLLHKTDAIVRPHTDRMGIYVDKDLQTMYFYHHEDEYFEDYEDELGAFDDDEEEDETEAEWDWLDEDNEEWEEVEVADLYLCYPSECGEYLDY